MFSIKDNFLKIKNEMASAALSSGRLPDDVKLLAVTKTVGLDEINELIFINNYRCICKLNFLVYD